MKQYLTLALAAVLAISFCSLALADPAGQKAPKKKTAVGAITKIDAKAKTIRVNPSQSGQQVQAQEGIQGEKDQKGEEGKPKRARQLLFRIDANTKITSRITQQQDAKGKPPEDGEGDFGLFRAGQVVRVVYTRVKAEVSAGQQDEAKAEKRKQNQGKDDKADKKGETQQQKRKPKMILKAISVEILAASAQQQQSTAGQSQPK